jgi:hypothetical protein
MNFYKFFGRCVYPKGVWEDFGFVMFYCSPDLVLEGVDGISVGGLEIGFIY